MATRNARTLTVSIERPPREVYEFVANAKNLPTWAPAFCKSVRRDADQWIVETPEGSVTMRFAEENDLGVLDHWVGISPGAEIHVPMRVVPNGDGTEVLFTVFDAPDDDVAMVERDLGTLKATLEQARG